MTDLENLDFKIKEKDEPSIIFLFVLYYKVAFSKA